MTGAQLIAIVVGVGSAALVLEMVRRRQLRDKYVMLWLLLAAGMTVLAFAPGLLDGVASVLSIEESETALFFVALLVLLAMIAHLSWEVSRLENETRVLSEEVALLRLEFEQSQTEQPADPTGSVPPGRRQ